MLDQYRRVVSESDRERKRAWVGKGASLTAAKTAPEPTELLAQIECQD